MKNPKDISILIVDDEKVLREMICNRLRGLGYQVSEACGGWEALEIFRTKAFNLVISDIKMPDGDGIELLEKVKSHSPVTPVMLTHHHHSKKHSPVR